MSQDELDQITDKVLAFNPDAPTGPLKVIAGAPDKPLVIGDIEIPCYVLENEMRVLSQSGMFSGLGLARRGLVKTDSGAQLPRFAASKAINPFISNDLMAGLTKPIFFRIGGIDAYGFPAEILVDVCKAVLAARDAKSLNPQQKALAERCDILIRALATVGIIALVDEATGYQQVREQRALATILERLIDKELNPWTRTFPFEFYSELCRLRKWPIKLAVRRPGAIGRYTNEYVYDRLAPGVLEELNERNPVVQETGRRKHKHHQWFTPDIGHPKLLQHIEGVLAIMRVSSSWDVFKRNMQKAYPKVNETRQFPFDED